MSSLDYLDLCRLCLVKDRVSVPIFEGEGDVRQIFLKIAACLPVKVGREDKLPKKICDDCVYKVELFYQFWNTTANAEKQLLQWLGDVSLDDKQGYVTGAHPSLMKPGQNPGENRLDGSVMQQVNDHPNNMGMGMLDSMGMGMPMMINTSGQQQQPQQQMTSVPMDSGGVQTVQAVPGPSTQSSHDQRKTSTNQEDDEDDSEEDDNSDDECDGDDGMAVKEESEEDPTNSRTIEPTTFVNVSLACDEAGPSGLQQQKIGEMPEMVMPPTDGDPKSGHWITNNDQSHIDTDLSIKEEDQDLTVDSIEAASNVEEFEGSQKGCELCGEKFHFVTRLVAHLRIAHGILRPFKCLECEKTYPHQFLLNAHVKKIHTPKTVPCGDCGFMGVSVSDVERHRKRNHRVTRYICEICSQTFEDESSLVTHTAMHDFMQFQQCHACGSTFNDARTLRDHNRLYHYDPAAELAARNVKHRSRSHGEPTMYEKRRYLCALCGKELKTAKGLEIHNRSHTGEKPYTCEVCGKCFACETLLRTHNVTHTGERKYSCDQCGKSFTQRSTLVVHKRYHSGERPYVCTRCGKGFVTRTVLKTHMKSCRL